MKKLNPKKITRAILPHAIVERYHRYMQDVNQHDKSDNKSINIKFLGELSDNEVIDTMKKKGAYIHFGQSAEDAILARIFQGKRNGFYIDIGAYHTTEISNTYILNRFLNWRGINIDASKEAINRIKVDRTDDINLNIAIGKKEGLQEFTMYSDPARSTFSDDNRKRQKKKGDTEIVGNESIEVKPLKKILDEYIPKGTQIDVLDIDIEGYDLQALETNDWNKYRPTVILIEDYQINTVGFNKSNVYKFMQKNNYRFFSHCFDTSIYIDNLQKIDIK